MIHFRNRLNKKRAKCREISIERYYRFFGFFENIFGLIKKKKKNNFVVINLTIYQFHQSTNKKSLIEIIFVINE